MIDYEQINAANAGVIGPRELKFPWPWGWLKGPADPEQREWLALPRPRPAPPRRWRVQPQFLFFLGMMDFPLQFPAALASLVWLIGAIRGVW